MRKEECYECIGAFELADNERVLCCNCENDPKSGEPCSWDIKSRKEKCKSCGHVAHVCIL